MNLSRLQLENFRNYSVYERSFSEDNGITVLLGPNGKGKTNLIEAVYTLSLGKSFRTSLTEDQVMWEKDYMRVKGEILFGDKMRASNKNGNNQADKSHVDGQKNDDNLADNSHVDGQKNDDNQADKSHVDGQKNDDNPADKSHMDGQNNDDNPADKSHVDGQNNDDNQADKSHMDGQNNDDNQRKEKTADQVNFEQAQHEKAELEVFCAIAPRKSKNFKKNGVNLKNSEYFGNFLTVLFHPEDLNILYLSPFLRRKYMNIILSQSDKHYLFDYSNYQKALKQRNSLLKDIREKGFRSRGGERAGFTETRFAGGDFRDEEFAGGRNNLEIWNEKLIEFGAEILLERMNLIAFFDERLEEIYGRISGKNEKVRVEYAGKIMNCGRRLDEIKDLFKKELESRITRDIRQAETTAGPHRDDIKFFLNNQNINQGASRGEFRTLLLALKLAEIEYITQKTGQNPVLLLDDVFSELDEDRQKHLFKSICNNQTIISATDLSSIEKSFIQNKNIELVNL